MRKARTPKDRDLSVLLHLRIDPGTLRQIDRIAVQQNRSRAAQARHILMEAVSRATAGG